MSAPIDRSLLLTHLQRHPQQLACRAGDMVWTCGQLLSTAQALANSIAERQPLSHRTIAIAADNSPLWLAADLACLLLNRPCLPLPAFFTAQQTAWALQQSGCSLLLTQSASTPWEGFGMQPVAAIGGWQVWEQASAPTVVMPAGTAKITFTSGSTGSPMGVCLSQATLEAVAQSLADVVRRLAIEKHLCALPLSLLLENVAGVYASLLAGACCELPSLRELGWLGSSQLDMARYTAVLSASQSHSSILLPQMLKDLLSLPDTSLSCFTPAMRFMAVGGARVAPQMIDEARHRGLPVYEGYGLSECGSVVCLNHPGADKPGTVGRPLAHVRLHQAADGELIVEGAAMLGYLGEETEQDVANNRHLVSIQTGDLAAIDSEGFVHIRGRRKNLLITSFGRNISPEWVESELLVQAGIAQCAVLGDGDAALSALIVAPTLNDAALQAAVGEANARLPDYARIVRWWRSEAFTLQNGLATANGRPCRVALQARWQRLSNVEGSVVADA